MAWNHVRVPYHSHLYSGHFHMADKFVGGSGDHPRLGARFLVFGAELQYECEQSYAGPCRG